MMINFYLFSIVWLTDQEKQGDPLWSPLKEPLLVVSPRHQNPRTLDLTASLLVPWSNKRGLGGSLTQKALLAGEKSGSKYRVFSCRFNLYSCQWQLFIYEEFRALLAGKKSGSKYRVFSCRFNLYSCQWQLCINEEFRALTSTLYNWSSWTFCTRLWNPYSFGSIEI